MQMERRVAYAALIEGRVGPFSFSLFGVLAPLAVQRASSQLIILKSPKIASRGSAPHPARAPALDPCGVLGADTPRPPRLFKVSVCTLTVDLAGNDQRGRVTSRPLSHALPDHILAPHR